MLTIRKAISSFLQNLYIYIIHPKSTINTLDSFSIDESLLGHIQNQQYWVVGVIKNNNLNLFRCNITTIRDSQYLNNFIRSLIQPGNVIVSEGWSTYSFLNNINSGYNNLTFNHGHGNFGHGINTTSHIEGFYGFMKNTMIKIYH